MVERIEINDLQEAKKSLFSNLLYRAEVGDYCGYIMVKTNVNVGGD